MSLKGDKKTPTRCIISNLPSFCNKATVGLEMSALVRKTCGWSFSLSYGPLVHDSLLVGSPPIGSGLVVHEVLLYIELLASWLVIGWSSH